GWLILVMQYMNLKNPPYSTLFRSRQPQALGRTRRPRELGQRDRPARDRSAAQPPRRAGLRARSGLGPGARRFLGLQHAVPEYRRDRKSTRLNSSHVKNKYAVF